ncbi:uncharacterized protein TNCV_4960371 [Trichonephila clavipes]|uniref:Uncharacterized protein n=1 Tax=Trichonephila clavipes TaxID=2585209 RepID=A0A8X6SH12_TRICX|nr:uncharacterized protein TNCV_4960371 [Trichonephila clavipes]
MKDSSFHHILEGKEKAAWVLYVPKIQFSQLHLDFFHKNCGAVSNEHGERFYQDIVAMECRYQDRWDESMLAEYCWTVIRDTLASTYKRQYKRKCS